MVSSVLSYWSGTMFAGTFLELRSLPQAAVDMFSQQIKAQQRMKRGQKGQIVQGEKSQHRGHRV